MERTTTRLPISLFVLLVSCLYLYCIVQPWPWPWTSARRDIRHTRRWLANLGIDPASRRPEVHHSISIWLGYKPGIGETSSPFSFQAPSTSTLDVEHTRLDRVTDRFTLGQCHHSWALPLPSERVMALAERTSPSLQRTGAPLSLRIPLAHRTPPLAASPSSALPAPSPSFPLHSLSPVIVLDNPISLSAVPLQCVKLAQGIIRLPSFFSALPTPSHSFQDRRIRRPVSKVDRFSCIARP